MIIKTMFRQTILATALVTLASTAALAGEGGPGPHGAGDLFKRLDQNQDGVISRDEAAGAPRLAGSFDKLDADHDGMLTQDEMRAAGEARHEEMQARMADKLKQADQNGDGLISKDEATASMPMIARNFDQLDTNKDGQLSQEELAAARQRMAGSRRR